MKKVTILTLALAVAAGFSAPCFAATSNWNGTWKLDKAKSHMTGGTVTITKTGPESYLFSNGTLSMTMVCDGKVHPTLAGREGTCTKLPGGGYEMTTLYQGKVMSKSHTTFAANGKKEYITSTDYLPNGKTTTRHSTDVRLSGTTGLAGKWRNTKSSSSSPGIMIYSVSGDTLHMSFPSDKETLDAKLDGTPATPMGPTAPKGITVSIKKVSARKLHETDRLNGKIYSEGTATLSPNGKTLTEVSWNPAHPQQKQTYVYKKQ